MIASTIGKTFLKAYNQKFETDYSAKVFFQEVFFSIFYDHEKYLQWVTNSPFVQGITTSDNGKYGKEISKVKFSEEDKFKEVLKECKAEFGAKRIDIKTDKKSKSFKILLLNDSIQRQERLTKLGTDILEIEPNASIAIGYSSTDILATTSGQVSNVIINTNEEEIYASWIGGGFGVGVKGGFSIYVNEPKVLLTLFEGWKHYRNYLKEMPKLRPNQIDTWNGQWLAHVFNKRYFNIKSPLSNFEPFSTKKEGVIELETQTWVKVVFGLSQSFPESTLLTYIFSLGRTNKTVGFIPIVLPKVRKVIDLYKKLFVTNEYLKNANMIENIFGNKNSIYRACERGAIGIRALEPQAIKDLMWKFDKKINYKHDDELQVVSFQTYITWILAMLNNEQLHQLSKDIVQLFLNYESTSERGKMVKSRAVENLMKSKSADGFLQELLSVVEEATAEEALKLSELIEQVNKLGGDNFKRFLILLKLQYSISKKQNQ